MHCTLKHWCLNPSVPVIHLWEHKSCWNCVHEAGECSVLQTHATSLVQVWTGWGGGDTRTEDLFTGMVFVMAFKLKYEAIEADLSGLLELNFSILICWPAVLPFKPWRRPA
ncbi:hypothetical protein Pyn_04101 [Prunus yedoensis var. nudiflora]|uniref:Uncharacterized protein n=1 Tax=Prunus yedoensis var. nudiflora TaxID=2094558 RepID=A0A314XPZ5_PRUYE|nr:hypothetical protein Pyn_04101 [Prunus yedoensis var. nudiflora]